MNNNSGFMVICILCLLTHLCCPFPALRRLSSLIRATSRKCRNKSSCANDATSFFGHYGYSAWYCQRSLYVIECCVERAKLDFASVYRVLDDGDKVHRQHIGQAGDRWLVPFRDRGLSLGFASLHRLASQKHARSAVAA